MNMYMIKHILSEITTKQANDLRFFIKAYMPRPIDLNPDMSLDESCEIDFLLCKICSVLRHLADNETEEGI